MLLLYWFAQVWLEVPGKSGPIYTLCLATPYSSLVQVTFHTTAAHLHYKHYRGTTVL